MPFNSDGSWTSPKSGKTYGPDVPASEYDPGDSDALSEELLADRPYTKAGAEGGLGGVLTEGPEQLVKKLGLIPQQIRDDAPGATLDVGNADAERSRLEGLLGQLQQQAATGSGEWENTLAEATQRAQQTASALSQASTSAGSGYQSALRNMGNAQSAASQRAVGQGEILRAQSMQAGQAQLGDLLAGQGQQDVEQARLDAAARQQRRVTNAELVRQSRQAAEGAAGAAGQAMMSDGGRVPGQPLVFGDDSRNDTQPAMLSPGEIVVPISKATDPDEAANFARAVAERKGIPGYAEGGDTGLGAQPGPTGEEAALGTFLPHIGIAEYYGRIGGGPQAASIENGGLLNAQNFDANRAASLGLVGQLEGAQPTVTSQQLTNAQDDTIAGALAQTQQQAQVSNTANVIGSAVAAQQGAGGEAAATRGNEQARTQQLLQKTLTQQRGRDLAMALAQQQAGWRNTALNAGLSADAMNSTMNAISGGAQAIGALSDAGGGRDRPKSYELDETGERGGLTDLSVGAEEKAHGGVVGEDDERARARRFLSLLGRAA